MTPLLAGELRRVLARRLVRWVFALAALGVVIGGVATFLKTQHLSQAAYEARVRAAQAQAGLVVPSQVPPGLSFCKPAQAPATSGPCLAPPAVVVHDPRFHLTSLKNVFEVVTAPLSVLALLIGASIIGAEWPSRTITTILTWEPRRLRVLAAKSMAVVAVTALLAVATLVVLGLALLPAAFFHGTTMGATSSWWWSLAGVLGRGTAMVALAALMGFSIATVGRNTAAALIVFFAYAVVIERFIAVLVQGWEQWFLLLNAAVLVSGHPVTIDRHHRTVGVAAVYLVALTAALYLVAAWDFRRRDVA